MTIPEATPATMIVRRHRWGRWILGSAVCDRTCLSARLSERKPVAWHDYRLHRQKRGGWQSIFWPLSFRYRESPPGAFVI